MDQLLMLVFYSFIALSTAHGYTDPYHHGHPPSPFQSQTLPENNDSLPIRVVSPADRDW